jgi:ribosomal protein S18 acetylase RimI-like enzyme
VGDAAADEASVSAAGGPGLITNTAGLSTDVVLARVRREDELELQALLDAGVSEVLALDGFLPDLDSAGHVRLAPARQWLETRGVHPFFLRWGGETVGCCVVRELSPEARGLLRVEMLYVRAEWRRRRLASTALCKLAEFGRLTGATGMVVDVSPNNGRARRFLSACGFRLVNPDQSVTRTDAGRQERTESAAAPDWGQRREIWMLEW